MSVLNAILRNVFGLLQAPFIDLPYLVGVAFWSLVLAVAALLVVKVVSNQEAIDAAKRRIFAGLFEIRLFNDDLRTIFRAVLDILIGNAVYLRYMFAPLLWMILPLILLYFHLDVHYGYRGLEVGEPALVKVFLKHKAGEHRDEYSELEAKPNIRLEVPEGIVLETAAVWMSGTRELAWRILPQQPGRYELKVREGTQSHTKELVVAEDWGRRSPERVARELGAQIMHPAEAPFPSDSELRVVRVAYPEEFEFLGGHTWAWILMLLSLVFAFVLRKPFGVTL